MWRTVFGVGMVLSCVAGGGSAAPVEFVAKRIGTYRSEACAVGDFTGDGKVDIVAGPFLYVAPNWTVVKIRDVKSDVKEDGKGYADDFCNLAMDVNNDGRLDILAVGWFNKTSMWIENCGVGNGLWKEHVIDTGLNHETATLELLRGAGTGAVLVPQVSPTIWYERCLNASEVQWTKHVVDAQGLAFGAGVGDVNGDGRPDIVRPGAWYEAPLDVCTGAWKKHPLALGGPTGTVAHSSNIIVVDVNKDGRMDLIASSAHKHGIWWYEQKSGGDGAAEPVWVQHVIDDRWSQAHFLLLADMDNDGVNELVTGKRFMAHNGSDPDEQGKLCVYYYDYQPGPDPHFQRGVIDESGAYGAGLNSVACDVDGDGDMDLVTTGKWGGPVIFENKLR